MRRLAFACLAAALSLASSQASRADDVIKSVTQAQVADLLKDAGYRAEIVPSQPRPFVRTGAGGRTVLVVFFDCNDAGCSAIQFYAGFRKSAKFTPAFTERWNSERRYAKAYINKSNGDLRLEYDIDLRGGVTTGVVRQGILLFEGLIGRFDELLRTTPVPPPETTASATPLGEFAGKGKDADVLAAEGKFIEAAAVLDDAANALWDKTPLGFRRTLWVAAPPEGFGNYNPRESNVYASGAPMIAYSEPIGFGWRQLGDVYQTDLAVDIVVKGKDGAELLRRSDFSGLKLGSRVRNHEFMMHFTYTLTGIPQGEYVLDTIVRDKVSGKNGTFSLPFVVR